VSDAASSVTGGGRFLATENPGLTMPNRTLRASLGALAFAACMICGGPAQAVFYGNDFDPISPLSFSGHATWSFDDACQTPGMHNASTCHLALLSVTVDMSSGPGNTGHLDFASRLPATSQLIDFFIDSNGLLEGIDTQLIGWVFPAPCAGTLCGTPWWIQWGAFNNDPVFLYTGSCDGPLSCNPDENFSGEATHVTFTRIGAVVPEPATLGLLLGALGAGWWVRRRKPAA
jgi:PEP-CTERM motif